MGYPGSQWIINLCSSLYGRVANVRVAALLDGKIKIWCLCLAKLFVHCNFQLPLFIRFVVLSFYIIAISYGVSSALYWNAQTCCNSKTCMPELRVSSFLQIIHIYALRLKLTALCKIQSNRTPTALVTRWPETCIPIHYMQFSEYASGHEKIFCKSAYENRLTRKWLLVWESFLRS
jgi:hypothetical protein